MLETLTAGLILSLISALAWIAYKHPEGYNRIYIALVAVGLFLYTAIMFYNTGINKAVLLTHPMITPVSSSLADSLKVVLESKRIASEWIEPGWYLFFAYIAILSFLHPILKINKKK